MSNVNNYIVYLEVFFFCFFSESIAQTIGQGNPFAIFQKDSLQQSKDIISNEEMFPPPLFPYLSNESHDLQGDVQVAWVNYYGVSCQPGFDEATAIAIDQLGNVYVTGYSPNELFGVDYLTIKYSPAGEEIWVKRYNNEENGNDKPCAISIDASGNVYVTGSSEFSGTSWDYVTVKYDSNGKEEWSARFNGIGNRDDMATAMDIDDEGNVYVTGNCRNATQYYDYDYATVKYNAAGVQQWIRRYAGSGNHDDRANALVVDRAGNVYVTGSCSYLDSNSDYTTIKYNSNGTEQWIARYNGQANGGDEANALAVDEQGNVYVTGASDGSFEDFATIKYNSTGNQQWVARYDGPMADIDWAIDLAIDKQGNVYVTGISRGSGYDYATIKYNSAGILQWVSRYNGAFINSHDKPSALAVDEQGNVYVTGNSEVSHNAYEYVTVRYNSAGNEQWIARSIGSGSYSDEAPAIVVDSQENVYVTGYNYATIKYTSVGVQQWVARYNSQGNSQSTATDMAVDELGNVYVAGCSSTSATSYDYATVKYNTQGIKTWVSRYNGRKNSVDLANALAIDGQGNVYVTGTCSVPGTYMDYATIKYNSVGTQQWIAYYDGTISDRDEASALEIDEEGNIYVTGKSVGLDTSYDFATIKYDSYGVEDWVARYAGPNKSQDEPVAIALDQLGNVYITGKCSRPDSSFLVTIKYNPAGTQEWIAYYYAFVADPRAIEVDHTGNVYVAGGVHFLGVTDSCDYFLVKYDLVGEEQWIAGYNGTNNWNDMATAMAIDDSGNVFVTGQRYGSGTRIDYATCKYNSSGAQKWIAYYNGPTNYNDQATALAVDASGSVYVTGYSMSARGYGSYDADYATVKYNSVGVQQWVAHYNSPGNGVDKPVALSLDNFGNVYVTGSSSGAGSVYTTIKYVQIPTAVRNEELHKSRSYSLSQNYPNPFNPATTIRFVLPKESFVTLKIYNLLGQEVAMLVDDMKPMGEHQVQWKAGDLPSGVYVYRLQARSKEKIDFVETRKLILLK